MRARVAAAAVVASTASASAQRLRCFHSRARSSLQPAGVAASIGRRVGGIASRVKRTKRAKTKKSRVVLSLFFRRSKQDSGLKTKTPQLRLLLRRKGGCLVGWCFFSITAFHRFSQSSQRSLFLQSWGFRKSPSTKSVSRHDLIFQLIWHSSGASHKDVLFKS